MLHTFSFCCNEVMPIFRFVHFVLIWYFPEVTLPSRINICHVQIIKVVYPERYVRATFYLYIYIYISIMSTSSIQMFCVMCCRWGEHEGHVVGERSFDLYPPAFDAGTLASRKSSSSTDSSSSHSLHSRSTTGSEGGAVSLDFLYLFLESQTFIMSMVHHL